MRKLEAWILSSANYALGLLRIALASILYTPAEQGKLVDRALLTEIGFSGHVSLVDDRIAKDRNLKPLTAFEKWLVDPYIKAEKLWRQAAFRQSIIKTLGEDPNDWA